MTIAPWWWSAIIKALIALAIMPIIIIVIEE